MEFVGKVKNATIRLSLAFARIILALMSLLVMVEVILRWGFSTSTMVSTDFAAYGMGIVFYWGACKAIDDDVFVRMDVLYDSYKGKFKKVINIICDFLLLIFNSNIFYYFFILLMNTIERDLRATNIYQTPLWIPRLLVLLGILLLEIYLVCRIIEDFHKQPEQYSNRELAKMGLQKNPEEEG